MPEREPTGSGRRRHDPGWQPAIRSLARSPWMFLWVSRSIRPDPGLEGGRLSTARRAVTVFAVALVAIGVLAVVLFAGSGGSADDGASVWIGMLIVGGIGCLALGSAVMASRKTLPCDDSMAEVWFAGFMMQSAAANTAAMIGFVGVVLTEEAVIYAVGAAFASMGHLVAVPTVANLARRQARQASAGCDLDLIDAITAPVAAVGGP